MGTLKFGQAPKKELREIEKIAKNGDLFFASGEYPLSGIIKKLSDSVVSHVGILWWWNDCLMILESVDIYGVRAVPLFNYFNNYYATRKAYKGKLYIGRHKQMPQDAQSQKVMLQVAMDLFGYSYDRADEWEVLKSRINKKIRRQEDDAFLCSEYVETVFKCINIPFATEERTGFIFPENIAADPQVDILYEIVQNTYTI